MKKIRAKFGHSRKGKKFERNEVIDNLTKAEQEEAVLNGLAYYDKPKTEIVYGNEVDKPTSENLKAEIISYLEEQGIEHDPNVTKSELLELC